MIGRFTGCRGAIVATGTGSDGLRMINSGNWYPGSGRRRVMTRIAFVGGINVIGWFALRRNIIVAAQACACNLRMIHNRHR